MMVEVERLAAALARRYRLPVCAVDETLSTAEARQQHFAGDLGRSASFRTQKDELAAQVILQMWLEQPVGVAIPGQRR
jgi:RNase H-fold protein (predicted Holliday junction resolvase)